ncbi:protein ARV 2 isoform X2 [Physcomitrium patens]|uniref:Protein ARV n=2 Tax=Physcomitrium patens TaxID=3218 RepID=A0A2K1JYC0_PHYPA|nr:protein arv1 homolog isoform X2 [Physcomitrium patens]PNR46528.1 hypothetical protein PHYPA_013647 [Physcomitrium patens]|eukprot:XP_024387572.1 protein arv1 homolog isoform X2 [Physcomitrella patens]
MGKLGADASMRCVHCGTPVAAVYVEYSPGNIRLSECAKCGFVADEYVECEIMIVVIDLILHKPEAYRHIFFNYPLLHKLKMLEFVWKTSLLVLLLDSCKLCLRGVGKTDVRWESLSLFLSTAGKVLAKVGLANVVFLITVLALAYALPNLGPHAKSKWTDLLMAVALSSYFKMFVFAMMVWEYSPLMTLIIDMLVLSSNTVALKVMLNTSTPIAATVIAAAAFFRTLCRISIDFVL